MSDPHTERQRKYAQQQRQERLREMSQQLSHTPTPSRSESESSVPSASGPTSSRRSDRSSSKTTSQSGDGGESSSETPSQPGSGDGHESPSGSDYQPSGTASSAHASDSYGTDEAVSDSTERAAQYYATLSKRKFGNTRVVDFTALQTLGLEEEFLRLTSRIGIGRSFWDIAQRGYSGLTLEFLSSLELKYNKKAVPYIKFRLRQEIHRVWVSQMREWFGFHPTPTISSLTFAEDLDRAHFWELISGKRAGSAFNPEYKQLNVPHPVLRCILRILSGTFFARGETMTRANVEDLQLLDHMLRPDGALERPDLMLAMIQHWLGLQRVTKIGGVVSISAYVTLIAERLGVPIVGDDECKGTRYFTLSALQTYKFIQPAAARDGRGAWAWRVGEHSSYVMPFPVTIDFADRSTWYFTRPPRFQQGPAAPPPPPPPTDDVEMPDAHTSPVQAQDEQMLPHSPLQMHSSPIQVPPFPPQGPSTSFAAGTSAFGAGPSTLPAGSLPSTFQPGSSSSPADPSYPPPVADPTIQDVYRLVYDMMREHGAILYDLQQRMDDMEDEMRRWRFDISDD